MRQRRIGYCVNPDDGLVWSHMWNGEGWAIPVYQFSDFGNDGDFTGPIPMELEHFPARSCPSRGQGLIYTRKIPVDLKNRHRKFWGMRPLAS